MSEREQALVKRDGPVAEQSSTPVHCPHCDRRLFSWAPLPGGGGIIWQDTCKRCYQLVIFVLEARLQVPA